MSDAVQLRHLIGDRWVDGGPLADDRNPARPDEVVARVPRGDRDVAALAADAPPRSSLCS